MSKTYRIKEFSNLTSVTIRTLHYYDEIGLITPSYKTLGGHRLYSEDDMFRLQQIITLKYMGFTLDQIKQIVLKPGFNFKKSLQTQAKIISDEAVRIRNVANLLENLVNQLECENNVDWKIMAKIIEAMQMNEINKKVWLEKYLTDTEKDEFNKILQNHPASFWEGYHRRWEELYEEISKNLHTDPESPIGMTLAKKWFDLVGEVYPLKSNLRDKIWQAFKVGMFNQDFPHNQEIINYISKAATKLKKETNMFE